MSYNKLYRQSSLRALLLILVTLTGMILPMVRPAVSLSQVSGTVFGWGANHFGQISGPSDNRNIKAIAAGEIHSLALKNDGTVEGWGDIGPDSQGQAIPPAGLSDVTAIDAGYAHSLALKSDGTVVGWGSNSGGQLNIPPGLTNVVAIAAGSGHNLALKNDGTVVAWGFDLFGQAPTIPPAGLSGVISIAAGAFNSMALKSDGTVVVWGFNSTGFLAPPAGLNNVVAIAAGDDYGLALIRAFNINDLIALVNGLNIHHGIKNSLLAKLNAARAAIEAGDTVVACNNLGAFINECQAQSGNKLGVAQADELIASATEIITSLGCP